MSSIALDRIQYQVHIPDIGQTTLDKVTETTSNASPSAVTVEKTKGKDAEIMNNNNVVHLDAPKAAVSDKVDEQTLKAMAQLQNIVGSIAHDLHVASDHTHSLAVKIIAGSVDDFELELAVIMEKLNSTQNQLKIKEVEAVKAKHQQEMDANQEKLKESEAAAKEAQKSGLASKIFGWVSAVVSVVVGAVMVATGVGAVAGALMIAGGVMGAVNMVLQEPAVQEAMKEAGVNVDVLNKVMMALEITVAVIGAVVTFGGLAAGGVAKLAAKGASQIAQKVTDISTKVAANMTKVADMGSKTATTMAKSIRYSAETVDLTTNIGQGTSQAVHSSHNANVTKIRADIEGLRAETTLSEAVIDKLKEEIAKLMSDFQELMSVIMQMIQAKGETMKVVMSRPATI
ncbi:type III secretion system translocon subunit SctE [Vibrio sp. AND4]|uniref:type III secretion system translocon subunit SctE n=1 Tax=Vibrio sp. AND4 TaxID=314289 RepID=UPI00015F0E23|nr:type III secretion system translocon subunit SctE [Vibrio sp. AND4]EDP58943.1 putative translocator protein PopB [Vibrio sp. AND4]